MKQTKTDKEIVKEETIKFIKNFNNESRAKQCKNIALMYVYIFLCSLILAFTIYIIRYTKYYYGI